jgi:dimethylaniline monooxygenase (N-oxide forming)
VNSITRLFNNDTTQDDSVTNIKKTKTGVNGARVCIIGAGIGGINMGSALTKKGIKFDCFDKRDRIGGIWAFDPKKEHTSVWHNLNQNTPRHRYEFSDFPMPDNYADFPSHQQVHSYLEQYIDHCGMRDSYYLNTGVKKVERLEDKNWKVTLESGEVRYYEFLIVANGHHNTPNIPYFPGIDTFQGDVTHSQHYRYRHDYKDKRVMVIGIGNSGAQIAVDVSYDAAMTYISIRRGVYILPHYLFGLRIDKILGPSLDWWFKKMLPGSLYGRFFTVVYNLVGGKHSHMEMPKPDHLMMTCLPTVSEGLPNRIGDGKLKIIPNIERIEGNKVYFVDGTMREVDSIIYSTGYHTDFKFLDPELLSIKDNHIPLYKRIFLPDIKNIAFVGVFQAIRWGFLDIMEKQAELIADYIDGTYSLPTVSEQRSDIEREKNLIRKEFMATLRNHYQMHGDTYIHELDLEIKAGKKRKRTNVMNVSQPIMTGNQVAEG